MPGSTIYRDIKVASCDDDSSKLGTNRTLKDHLLLVSILSPVSGHRTLRQSSLRMRGLVRSRSGAVLHELLEGSHDSSHQELVIEMRVRAR
jgi:hypothetical protein